MKKVMIAALALTLFGGAAFAQKVTPKASPKQEVKQEQKTEHAKHMAGTKVKHEKKAVTTEAKAQPVVK